MRPTECDRVEELLPLYIDGELSAREAEELDAHLAACAGCSRALETYMELESALAAMPGILPDPHAMASGVTDRLGLGSRLITEGIFRRLSLVWTFAVITAALILLVGRFDYVSALMSGQESLVDSAGRTMEYWVASSSAMIVDAFSWIDASLAADPWTFAICMTGFGLLIFTAGMVAALKTIR